MYINRKGKFIQMFSKLKVGQDRFPFVLFNSERLWLLD